MSKYKLLSFWFSILLIASCAYPERIKDGTTAYQRMQYSVAADMLTKEFGKTKSGKEKGQKAYLAGRSYERINDNGNATIWYKKAYDNNYGVKALMAYAYALKKNEDYSAAADAFKQVGQLTGELDKYKKESETCKMVADWLAKKEDSPYAVEKLDFNTGAADYAPSIYENNTLVFTSDRELSAGKKEYKWTGVDFSDLFQVNLESGEVTSFSETLNTEYNEGTISFNSTYTAAYFTRCGSDQKKGVDYCKILFSKKKPDGTWTNAKIMPFVSGAFNFAHPFLADDNTLYFSSNRPGGMGKADLYYVKKTDDGWSSPASLGRYVNTAGDEKFPFVKGDSLYFASNGHPGMGGLDLFLATKGKKGKFKKVENLKPPMNSGNDDFALVLDTKDLPEDTEAIGYFSSTRLDGQGKDDIYRFSKQKVEEPPVVIEPEQPPPPSEEPAPTPEIVYEFILNGTVLEKMYGNPEDPNSKVLGFQPLQGAKIFVSAPSQKIVLDSDEKGNFTTNVTESTRYTITASKEGYFTKSTYLTVDEKDPDNPKRVYTVELVLDKIFKNKEITLEDIYYDYDKWYIRPDAEPSLNRLITILQQNPTIRIQLSSHTDCRGNNAYNKTLSQKRAQSAVDYLISRGIEANRLAAVGYGEESPAITCKCSDCTEDEHQANRRTTFKVIE